MKHKNTKPRGAAQAKCTKRLGNITITLLAILLAFSCSKYEDLPTVEVEKDPITLAKEQFQRDSIAFARSGVNPNYNFRQSLTRRINWSESISTDSLLYVPLRMVLPDGTVTSDGANELPNKAWLVIGKDEDDNSSHYRMVTLFPDSLDVEGEFSGIALFEDYFLGDVSYGEYTQGSLLSRQSSLRRRHRSGDGLKANMPLDCEWITVATVCVGYMPGGSSEPTCSDRYEYQCSYSGGGDDGGGALPPGSGNTGGSSGGGSTPPPSIPSNATIPGQEIPAVQITRYIDCFKSISNNGAKYKVTIYVQEPSPESNQHFGDNGVGHVAIGLIKTGSNGQSITQVLGFYPQGSNIFKEFSGPSKVVDNGNSDPRKTMKYTIKMDFDLGSDGINFQKILNKVGNPSANYHAFENNCVRYAYEAAKEGGLNVPLNLSQIWISTNPNHPFGPTVPISAYTPAGMAQAMRNAKAQGDNRINTATNLATVPKSKGPC